MGLVREQNNYNNNNTVVWAWLLAGIQKHKMADENLVEVAELYRRLQAEWANKNLQTVGELLPQLKVRLLTLSFLPTGSRKTEMDERFLVIARNMLEIGAFWSLECRDVFSFERYVAQLKSYYFDYSNMSESASKFTILGLNLMRLLAQNRLGEFHTELEMFPPDRLQDVYIKKPVSLEQFLMEGNYHKIFLSKEDIPNPYYALFIDILIETIRNEIAACAEKAYSHLSKQEAVKLLMVDGDTDLQKFVNKRGWTFDQEQNMFQFSSEDTKQDSEVYRSPTLIAQCLGYAKELEKIV